MLRRIFLDNGDDFPVGTMLRTQDDRFVRKLNVRAPWFFRFFLAESDIVVPRIQNPTDICDSLITLQLQPATAGNFKGRLDSTESPLNGSFPGRSSYAILYGKSSVSYAPSGAVEMESGRTFWLGDRHKSPQNFDITVFFCFGFRAIYF